MLRGWTELYEMVIKRKKGEWKESFYDQMEETRFSKNGTFLFFTNYVTIAVKCIGAMFKGNYMSK